jgi:hypothetical protein
MKKLIVLFAVTLSIILVSCKKDNVNSSNFLEEVMTEERNSLPDVIQILDLLKQPTDGYVYIHSVTSLGSQSLRGPELTTGGFIYDKSATKQNFGTLSFSSSVVPFVSTTSDYSSFGDSGLLSSFGTSMSVSLGGSGSLPGFNSNFYLPKLMTLSSPSFSNLTPFGVNSTLTWNSDSQNQFGVGIAIRYDPLDPGNKPQNFGGDRVTKLIQTEDDGSYMLSNADLDGIPVGAIFELHIGRGNYSRVSMLDNYNVGIIGYSVINHTFTRQ